MILNTTFLFLTRLFYSWHEFFWVIQQGKRYKVAFSHSLFLMLFINPGICIHIKNSCQNPTPLNPLSHLSLTIFTYFLPDKKVMSKITLFPYLYHPIFSFFPSILDKKVVSWIGKNRATVQGKGGKFFSISFINTLFESNKINTFNLIPYPFTLLILKQKSWLQ